MAKLDKYPRFKKISEEFDALIGMLENISSASSVDVINDIEKRAALSISAISAELSQASWDLKKAVTDRRLAIHKEQDEALNKELGL